MTVNLLDMTLNELTHALSQAGAQPYRAGQLADWVYKKGVCDTSQMTNIPAALGEQVEILTSHVVATHESADGCTKLLIELRDGNRIETVLIPGSNRATACISTQVGCAMGCAFCASGMDGLQRNLTAGEIIEQILHLWCVSGTRPTNVVFMGMGEPLANYAATVAAARAIIDPQRLAISARKVTISTVGLPVQIRRLAAEDMPITLAVSLHAANDALRSRLMPAASKHSIKDILAAAKEFYQSRKREVTLEYVLLAGVNDSASCAEDLADVAHELRCNVNLIRYNPVAALGYARPAKAAVEAFAKALTARGVNVHVRSSRGLDSDAACGQLRRRLG